MNAVMSADLALFYHRARRTAVEHAETARLLGHVLGVAPVPRASLDGATREAQFHATLAALLPAAPAAGTAAPAAPLPATWLPPPERPLLGLPMPGAPMPEAPIHEAAAPEGTPAWAAQMRARTAAVHRHAFAVQQAHHAELLLRATAAVERIVASLAGRIATAAAPSARALLVGRLVADVGEVQRGIAAAEDQMLAAVSAPPAQPLPVEPPAVGASTPGATFRPVFR